MPPAAAAVGVERPSAGALRMNASRFFGEPIISIGEVCPERLEGATAEVLVNRDGVYRKLVHHQGRLAGALLYGDISGAGVFIGCIGKRATAPLRSRLGLADDKTEPRSVMERRAHFRE